MGSNREEDAGRAGIRRDPLGVVLEGIELFKSLSDETRQRIIFLLGERGEMCVGDIASNFNLYRSTISHHLASLKRVGLVKSRKEGKTVFYSLNTPYIVDTLDEILSILKTYCM